MRGPGVVWLRGIVVGLLASTALLVVYVVMLGNSAEGQGPPSLLYLR